MYTVKNNSEFAKEIAEQDPRLFMASLDVESLFTNIPLEKTVSVCCDSLFWNDKIHFGKPLRCGYKNQIFHFQRKNL